VDLSYALTPFVAWIVAGTLKFSVNSIRAGKLAFGLIGYGGLPSNHSAIVSSMAALIGLREGVSHPAFGIAIAVAFIVILDAASLRRQVGKQAIAVNRLASGDASHPLLRERIGHTPVEIAAGIIVGILVALAVYRMSR
jgi:acid phosphatase family membrane protein YuiD